MALQVPILTYHSQNVSALGQGHNDHLALREDLEALHAAGWRIVSLETLLDGLDEAQSGTASGHDFSHEFGHDFSRTLCLSFDDGCDFDVRDLDFPGAGLQRSFLGILEDFQARHGAGAQPGLHATSFVIADPEARRVIDAKSLFGQGWISDTWWSMASRHPLLALGNHGWNHCHPDLLQEGESGQRFLAVDSLDACRQQVVRAAQMIEQRSGQWPKCFAYPFGEYSDFIRKEYFPAYQAEHGCRAAFTTNPGCVTADSEHWALPRYVCGRDWNEPAGLLRLLDSAG